MCLAGLVYLAAGAFTFRKEIGAARAWDKLITLGPIFIAVSLAAFAPEHFRGPEFVQNMVPSYMPARPYWAYFVGCALLAAAAGLTVRKFERLSTTLLGLMFFLFVCMLYLPSALRHPGNRFAWAYIAGAILLAAGIGVAINKKSRIAAASIGALMTALTLFLYVPVLALACSGSAGDFNDAINYVADTLLYAGSALALALALPND